MKLYALVGESGTGKSYNALKLAKDKGIECIIDDGLLISNHKIIAGTSAKKEQTKIASVKHAIFFDESYAKEMREAIKDFKPLSLLILGTSDRMVKQIAEKLGLSDFDEIIYIEDISSEESIRKAKESRIRQGKHVIPIPTMEVKQDFSGYFLRSLKSFRKKNNTGEITQEDEKTIIRPTYSYLGEFTISDNVLSQIIAYEIKKLTFVEKINSIRIDKLQHGIGATISINIFYGNNVKECGNIIKQKVSYPLTNYASINVAYIDIFIKNIIF